MNRKSLKVLAVLLIIMLISFSISSVYALDISTLDGSDATADVGGIQNIGIDIVSLISSVAMVVAVVVLMVLGIKYMVGSAEAKSEYKKTMMPYVVGAVLIFAASGIAGMIYRAANNIKPSKATNTDKKGGSIVHVAELESVSTVLDKYIVM